MRTKIVRFHAPGGPEELKLEEQELASPGPHEVLIRHHAIGVNFIEIYFRSGLYQTNLPSGLGTEAAGVIMSVGQEVKHLRVGDRVAYATGPLGSYSEMRVIPTQYLVKIPSEISFEEAAGGMLKGLTVQYLFRQTYQLKRGETVLFHAAAGGVGTIACQWARHLGVKLIGTVSSSAKSEGALKAGAWQTIDYTKEDVVKRVIELSGGQKLPVVYDGVGHSTWETSLDCLSPRGLLVSFGNASGPVTNVNLGILAQKGSLFVTRPTLNTYADTPEKLQVAADELFDLVSKKIIQIQVNKIFPLAEVRAAHEYLASRHSTGSTVLIP